MKVKETYFGRINRTGEGDLVLFRDVVLIYCAALRNKQPFFVSATSEASELLTWLGVEYQDKETGIPIFADPERADEGDTVTRPLACASTLPSTPLSHFREQGFQGTTLFAALVRSSYGPAEQGYFPTKSELGFYFDEKQLRTGTARWDQEYLTECQQFFFEELTPAELLEQSLERLSSCYAKVAKQFESELLGVAFLVGEQTGNLNPLTDFFRNLLSAGRPLRELTPFIRAVSEWNPEQVEAAWVDMNEASRESINQHLLNPVKELSVEVLLTCGAELLNWKATH